MTNDDEYAAKAALYAGSYEKLWKKHYGLDPEMMDRRKTKSLAIPCACMK